MAVTGTAEVMFATLFPTMMAGVSQATMRVVIRGAGDASQGNQVYQDKSKAPHYGEAGLVANSIVAYPSNGIVVTRVPYTFESANVLANAPYSVKEELARFVERGVVVVVIGGVVQTALQIRTLTP